MKLFSMDAEHALLGGLLFDNESYWRINSVITAGDFHSSTHQQIFSTISRLIESDKPADVVTVCEENKNLDLGYLVELTKTIPTAVNIESYAKHVREFSQKRQIYRILNESLTKLGSDKLDDLISDTQTKIENIVHQTHGNDICFSEVMTNTLTAVQQIEKNSIGETVGAPTGIEPIDRRTGGLYGPRLWCVAARPGIGKTAMTLQWAVHAASKGYKVGICSLEMGEDELAIRTIASQFRENVTAISLGEKVIVNRLIRKFPDSDIPDLSKNIWIDSHTFALPGIISRVTEWKRKHNIDFVIIDHIGLIEVEGFSNRNDQLGAVSRTLKKLCKRLNIPVVVVSQLNRRVEQEHRLPRLSDLRDSGNIEQDIDVGVFIHAKDEQPNGEIDIQIGLLKNRKGIKGWLPEHFTFNGAIQTFSEINKN